MLFFLNLKMILWLRRFMYNRKVVCGIIPDVMTLSAEWLHLFYDVILTALWRYLLFLFNLKGSLLAISVSDLKLCNLIITYLRILFLRNKKRKFLSQGTYNAVDLLDAHEDSVVDIGIIWKHTGLIFCMGKV
jgi:hypothetical protein